MHTRIHRCIALAFLLACTAAHSAAPRLPTEAFFKDPQYRSVKISPDGRFLAVIMPAGSGREMLAFIDLESRKVSGSARFTGSNTVVDDFRWVSDERVVIASATKVDGWDEPMNTGDLYAVNADGSEFRALVGINIRGDDRLQSAMATKRDTLAFYGLLHALPDDPRTALVWSRPVTGADWSARWSFPVAMRMDVRTGRTTSVVKGPVQGGMLFTDPQGNVRFADGFDDARAKRKLMYRDADGGDWRDLGPVLEQLGEETAILGVGQGGDRIYAIGDSEDSRDLFVIGADGGAPQRIAGRNGHDVHGVEWSADRDRIVAVEYMDGRFRREYLEAGEERARLLRMLEEAFPGEIVEITSTTRDRKRAVVLVRSDVNSGDYYLFEVASKKVEYLFSRRPGLDPEDMAAKQPIVFAARDGLQIHGYLTRPKGAQGPGPLVVLVHGGPHGPRDGWNFEPEVQFLANRGYSVLQVNFRGSGGYGPRFEAAGYKRWGTAMQDDVTDATRWAIAEGHADPRRICIAGASYGGYAALMGVGREPDLYRCAFGYVGVYDLPLMYGQGDIPESTWGTNYLRKALGTDQDDLRARSPITHVGKIKAALFLAHGGKDERAHPEHYHRLKRALEAVGKPYEDVWEPNEGHGFLQLENQVALYDKLAAFLARHIGGG